MGSPPDAAPWPEIETLHTVMFDFDGVFTDNTVYVFEDGREAVRCSRGDGLAIDWLRRRAASCDPPVSVSILSTETNAVVAARARKPQLPCVRAVGHKLAHMDAHWRATRPTDPEPFRGLLYAGNDLNDLAVMRRAAFSVAPEDADPRVRAVASAVLPYRGGHGFVRALVERLLRIDQLSGDHLDELVSDR
jgi:3-deoxy-D-manno-octulosonate 8-phosphate phosphatase KdsC-like HAD superfamily phosphatase